jgi:hypothetical protein
MKPFGIKKFEGILDFDIQHNVDIISSESGKALYRQQLDIFKFDFDESEYKTIPNIFKEIGIEPHIPFSKRQLYKEFQSGIVAGAGFNDDCKDVLNNPNWKLYDLTDERDNVINKALGHENSVAKFKKLDFSACDSLNRSEGGEEIEVISIDSLDFDYDFLSIDAEGLGCDILCGAEISILKNHPTILASVYHNWHEYLMIIPMLYDMGYEIDCIKTSSSSLQYPQSELAVIAKWS